MAARLLQVVVIPYRGCSFTAVTRVQIPSGTPNLFRKLRAIAEAFVGTKRHKSDRIPTSVAVQSPLFSRISSVFSQAQKGTRALHFFQPAVASDALNNLITSL